MSVDISEVKEVKVISSLNNEHVEKMNKHLNDGTWILLNVVSGMFQESGTPYQQFTIGRVK